MIAGIGTDIVSIQRMEEKIKKSNGFRKLVFSPAEIAYCDGKAHPYQHYAARFAAKEAFLKAVGTGWATGTAFNEIIITNEANGRPVMQLAGTTAHTLQHLCAATLHVSLSHTQVAATAVVVIEMPG